MRAFDIALSIFNVAGVVALAGYFLHWAAWWIG